MVDKNKNLFLILSFLMALIVILSNYLVQFPVKAYNLEELLTYGAFTYPVTFLITDLTNRAYGKIIARKIVNFGFVIGILLTFLVTNFSDLISIRIACGSAIAFIIAQNIDLQIFDKLRKNRFWFIPPFVSSLFGSLIDTILFFSISFYATGIPWVTLALGDFLVKFLVALILLIPFRLTKNIIKDFYSKTPQKSV